MRDEPNLISGPIKYLNGHMPSTLRGKEWRLPSDGDVICNTKTEATKTQPCERLCVANGACSNFFKVTKPRMENLHKANIQIQFAAYFIINFFFEVII